jgi:hypothetical protein
MQHSVRVYYFVYTSLHVFTQPGKGKAVGKSLKNSRCSFIKEVIDRKKNFIATGTAQIKRFAI